MLMNNHLQIVPTSIMLIFLHSGLAQQLPLNNTRNFMHDRYLIERMSNPEVLLKSGGTVQTLPMAPPDVLGSERLYDYYNLASFLLNDSTLLEAVPARFYVLSNEFEIKTKQGPRALKGDKVKSFVWIDSASRNPQYFVNMKEFKRENGVSGTGFMQILTEGNITLLKQTEILFKEANYHVALNVGNRDHEFIRRTNLYYLKGDTFQPLPSRKKLLSIFPDKQAELQKFVKLNQLDLGNEHHILALIGFYNKIKEY